MEVIGAFCEITADCESFELDHYWQFWDLRRIVKVNFV